MDHPVICLPLCSSAPKYTYVLTNRSSLQATVLWVVTPYTYLTQFTPSLFHINRHYNFWRHNN